MTPLLSIIIPVYNVENFLKKCISSVLEQTFSDFELIIVNDGSTDNSLFICQQFANKDFRIKVVDKANGGVSDARNFGIEEAKGEWITFVDSDDWIEVNYLKTLINKVEDKKDVDWVTSGLVFRYADGNSQKEYPDNTGYFSSVTADGLYEIATQKLVTSPVSKLYRNSVIKDNGIRFNTYLSFAEDRDFNLNFLRHCNGVVITDYCGYFYRRDLQTSLSAVKKGNIIKTDIEYWKKLYDIFKSRDFLTGKVKKYLVHRLYYFISDAIYSDELSGEQIDYLKKNVNWFFLRHNICMVKDNPIRKYLVSHKFIRSLITFKNLI